MEKEILGNITLYTADCMDVMRQYPDGYFDLAIVDPPYFDGPQKLGYYGAEITKIGVRRTGYVKKHWDVPGADCTASAAKRIKAHQAQTNLFANLRNLQSK